MYLNVSSTPCTLLTQYCRTTTLDVFKYRRDGRRRRTQQVELQHWMYLNIVPSATMLMMWTVELQHWMYLNKTVCAWIALICRRTTTLDVFKYRPSANLKQASESRTTTLDVFKSLCGITNAQLTVGSNYNIGCI